MKYHKRRGKTLNITSSGGSFLLHRFQCQNMNILYPMCQHNERSSVAGTMQPTSHCSACSAEKKTQMATLATSTHYTATDLLC